MKHGKTAQLITSSGQLPINVPRDMETSAG